MRYLCIYKSVEGVPPSQKTITEMGALIEEMSKKGVLLATEGCLPSATGFKIRRSGETYAVTDGPFTESKEVIGGFALIDVKSKDDAIAWTKRFLYVAGDGESEIRLLCEQSPMAQ